MRDGRTNERRTTEDRATQPLNRKAEFRNILGPNLLTRSLSDYNIALQVYFARSRPFISHCSYPFMLSFLKNVSASHPPPLPGSFPSPLHSSTSPALFTNSCFRLSLPPLPSQQSEDRTNSRKFINNSFFWGKPLYSRSICLSLLVPPVQKSAQDIIV